MSGVTQMDMYTGNRYFVLKYLKSKFMSTNYTNVHVVTCPDVHSDGI